MWREGGVEGGGRREGKKGRIKGERSYESE